MVFPQPIDSIYHKGSPCMSGFSIALPALCLLLSIVAAFFAARSARIAQDLRDRFERFKTQQMRSPSDVGSLSARLDELESTMEVLANRVKMQKVRNAANHAERADAGLADPYKDPDRWRQQMNAQLSRDKFRVGKT